MTFFIYHPQPGSDKPVREPAQGKSLSDVEAEYKEMQKRFPSREMALVVENEYGETLIHIGHWD